MSTQPTNNPPGVLRRTFTEVAGVSDRQGMPRIGKLRLGEKGISARGAAYPKEIDYFRIDPDAGLLPEERQRIIEKFSRLYGERPTVLTDVFFPADSRPFVFPNSLEAWVRTEAGSKRICSGNGVEATRLDMATGTWNPIQCCHVADCEIFAAGRCKLISRLRILLPRVTLAGYFQVDTSSKSSTANILDLINQLERLFGRLTSIPLVLSREPKAITYEGKATTHYILHLRAPNVDLDEMKRLVATNQLALSAAPAELEIDDEDLPEELVAGATPYVEEPPTPHLTRPRRKDAPAAAPAVRAPEPAPAPEPDDEPPAPEWGPDEVETVAPPKPAPAPPPAPERRAPGLYVQATREITHGVDKKTGAWTLYGVTLSDGVERKTFSTTVYGNAKAALVAKQPITFEEEQGAKGPTVVLLEAIR